MQYATITDFTARIDRHMSVQMTMVTDPGVFSHMATGTDYAVLSHEGALPDHSARSDAGRGFHMGAWIHHGGGMNARCRSLLRIEQG